MPVDTLLYTTSVINTPSGVRNDINMARERVMNIVLNPIRSEASLVLEEIRLKGLEVGGIDGRAIAWRASGFIHDLSTPLFIPGDGGNS
jgi:hypothetical protein